MSIVNCIARDIINRISNNIYPDLTAWKLLQIGGPSFPSFTKKIFSYIFSPFDIRLQNVQIFDRCAKQTTKEVVKSDAKD